VKISVCALQRVPTICTAATYDWTAAEYLQEDQPSRRHQCCEQRSLHSKSKRCSRIHCQSVLHSFVLSPGRFHGHTCWTSCRCDSWMHHSQRYPSTRTPLAHSFPSLTGLWTYCNRRSTSCWGCHVTASRISACIGHLVSADWVVHFLASSCRQSRWNQP